MAMETDEMEYLVDTLESLEPSEYDYAERRRPRRPVPRPTGRRLTRPAPQQGSVTRNEFNAAMERVQRELTATSNGLRTLDGRVNTLSTSQERLSREVAARKRENEAMRRDLRQTRELAAILPLLTSAKSTAIGQDVGNLKAADKVLVDTGDSLSALLPLVLLGGLGGDSSSQGGGLGSGGLDSSLLVLLLALRK